MMKKAFILLLFLFFASSQMRAIYSTDWIRPADDHLKTGSMITRDKANNVLVVGYIQSNNMFTRKYNKFGDLLWEKTSSSGINSVYEKPMWVNTDASNHVFVAGYQYAIGSGVDFPSAIVAWKYNAAGTLLWKQTTPVVFNGNTPGVSFNLRSEVDAAGNFYIGSASMDRPGFVLIKFSPAGAVLFNNDIPGSGGMFNFVSLRLKGDKIVMTGKSDNQTAKVVMWNTSGAVLWNASLAGNSGNDVEIDGSGNTYVLTSLPNQVSATSGQDAKIYKLNPSGVQLWVKNYHFGGQDFPRRFTLVGSRLTAVCTNILSGNAYMDWLTFQVNTSGTMLWNSRYSGTNSNDERPFFLAAKTNGEVFVTGVGGPTPTPNTPSNLRMITLKYGNTGATQWVDSLNIYSGTGIACTLASDNSLFVLGSTRMTAIHLLDHTGTGSCGLPAAATVSNITNTGAKITWTAVSGANLYHLKYKPSISTVWTTISTNLLTKTLTNLASGTSYDFAVEAVCSSGPSGFSATQNFATTGGGICTTGGLSQAQEYLNFVWIGGINNFTTTPPTSGYSDYTALSTNIVQGTTVSGYLSGLVPYPEYEYYRIWIDYNHDNDFTDVGELVVDLYSDFTGWIAINFTVPANAPLGSARMRITQSHDAAPTPCGSYARGETEDYTVFVVAAANAPADVRSSENSLLSTEIKVFPNPFSDQILIEIPNLETTATISIFDVAGKLVRTATLLNPTENLDLNDLNAGLYFTKISAQDGSFEKTVRLVKQ